MILPLRAYWVFSVEVASVCLFVCLSVRQSVCLFWIPNKKEGEIE